MPGIIGKKLGMSQVIQDDGCVIPVTFVQCEPNEVVYVKTEDKDGYPAIVLGFDAYKNPSKNKKFKALKEFRVESTGDYKKGQKITLDSLKEVEEVTIVSTSKGKGYQGVIKRHKFSRGPESHGSHHHREPGSIGTCAKPGRVLKGKKMPGHMGIDTVTLKKRPVVTIVAKDNVVAIKGPIPGANNGYVYIKF
ncbi:50S ribosomal protein L3 [Patescibacteria group bacterium]|nr:50S ribosomal protein L3 [Patescibacteria group bacterium]MBU1683012.1 50S ribosomal protein L3 [Patescibacteria group bacterium]MBU1934643.1 50S ribosomal protein L3 [Patescibacteria group bacterium]